MATSLRQSICINIAYLLQSRNRLLLRRASGCFAFPAHARRSHRTTPLCLLIFPIGRLSPCARLLELPASQASQSRHILLIFDLLCFFSTERIDESYIKAPPPHPAADSPLLRMRGRFLGDKADLPLANRVKVHKCAGLVATL